MRRRSFLALAGACAAALASPAAAQEGLRVHEPWSRATPGGAKVAAGYLAVENRGSAPDRLLGGASEIAGRVEIHETVTEGGVSRMRPLDGLPVPPGGRVELRPGGLHLMFMDLKRPLKEGERFRATLRFERAGAVPVEFAVRGIGAGGHRHGH
ncbi:MAG TPA: copper chaperone PCu(A)C [Beijerinckiaceae bacterium]|nr:copper chaperone PCu(A)C [Beijerinckiaceae bacterium]